MHATNESMLSNGTMLTNDVYSNGTKNETNVLNQMYLYWATDPRYLATTYLMFKIGKVQLYLLITVVDPGFPRGGGANSPGMGANIRFCQIRSATA